MTIASSILALSPVHYWQFNEPPGSTSCADSGSNPVPIISQGDPTGVGFPGPEIGTYAMRVYTTSLWKSAALGLPTVFGDTSVSFFFTVPAAGGMSSNVTFFGMGDITTIHTRGYGSSQYSSAAGSLIIVTNWSNSNINWTVGSNVTSWHVYTVTQVASTGTRNAYLDGNLMQSVSGGLLSPGWLATDYAWISSAQPVVFAHQAYWSRVLSAAEISTIGSQIVSWPGNVPINGAPPVSPAGGVTINPSDPSQAAQTDLLNKIYAAVHKTF